MKQLCVLMSTYNGEEYVIEQLDSIFSQMAKDCHISALIRDDGSTDNTVLLCKEYVKRNGYDIEIIEGENIKPARSFLELIRKCPTADFYAFCDQDDIWLPGKVQAAISCLEDEKPVLWYSNYNVVDDGLNLIHQVPIQEQIEDPLRVLFYNNVPGCVMVFNYSLLVIMKKMQLYDFRMHDILALDLALVSGRVIFERRAFILYRQHKKNAIGYGHKRIKPLQWLNEKIKYLANREDYHIRDYAKKVLDRFGDVLSQEVKIEFGLLSEYRKGILGRLRLLSKPYTKDGFNRTSLSIRLKILLGVF